MKKYIEVILAICIAILFILFSVLFLKPKINTEETQIDKDIAKIKEEFYSFEEKNQDIESIKSAKEQKIEDISYTELLEIYKNKIYFDAQKLELLDTNNLENVLDAVNQRMCNIDAKIINKFPNKFYGKMIFLSNYKDTPIKKWSIFHSDGENVYIIANEFLTSNNLNEYETYNPNLRKNSKNIIFSHDYCSYLKEKYNMPSVSDSEVVLKFLKDTEIWSNVFNFNFVEYAIATPTFELFVESYNNIYPENKIILNGKETYLDNKTDKYYITDISNTRKQYDDIYILDITDLNINLWFATPSYEKENNFVRLQKNGILDWESINYNDFQGLRPIICLKKDVVFNMSETGIIEIKGY